MPANANHSKGYGGLIMTEAEVFEKVREVLENALAVDEEEVTPEAKLTEDLGAESIDFLDIVFQLEKAFGIKIDQKEMFPEDVLNDDAYVSDGKVTDEGIAKLRTLLPHVDLDEFDGDRKVENFSNVFTVNAIVKFVQARID